MATINLSEETKSDLDTFKIVPRDTYEDVIKRLIKESRKRGLQENEGEHK